jgi:chloramphenicol 3-O phosphotransferase
MRAEVKVIILEGTSSSGKTTLARELQAKLDGIYLHCQLDAFWNMTPPSVSASSLNFPRMKLAMAKSVRALADTGHNVIVDIVYGGLKSHLEFSNVLTGINTWTVKLSCSLGELERRELARGDRRPGLARSQFELVREPIPYDLELDTSILSPSECAARIARLLD